MRPITIALGLLLAASASAPVLAGPPATGDDALPALPAGVSAYTPLVNGAGETVGRVSAAEGPTGVLFSVEVDHLSPGWHGMHLHAVGDCSDTALQKSGGHMNHAEPKAAHGLLADGGPDFGDLPNLWIGPDGKGAAQVFSPSVTFLKSGVRASMSDADGTALVIHAGPDDQRTQPIGGAGARVACAVVARGG